MKRWLLHRWTKADEVEAKTDAQRAQNLSTIHATVRASLDSFDRLQEQLEDIAYGDNFKPNGRP